MPIKLSQAIRDGSKITKKVNERYFFSGKDGICTCALGAAAITVEPELLQKRDLAVDNKLVNVILFKYFPELFEGSDNCVSELHTKIICMNDSEDLSREEIANKLEEIGL